MALSSTCIIINKEKDKFTSGWYRTTATHSSYLCLYKGRGHKTYFIGGVYFPERNGNGTEFAVVAYLDCIS